MNQPTERAQAWTQTMYGHAAAGAILPHADSHRRLTPGYRVRREDREQAEAAALTPGATLAHGAGQRARAEEPDPERTCFERDRDRIIHSTAFRRLAGKTQVVVFPTDHQRTRLTHALEVAQVAESIARGLGVNVSLTVAMALGHDCGHGPGGHAAEDAFDIFLPQGYEHGPWGADVVLAGLNLCQETLDGIRNHSWSRPAPATIEGEVVSWADRIAYCAHDLEDAIQAGILSASEIPAAVVEVAGGRRPQQIRTFIRAILATAASSGYVGMDATTATALAELRAFNYERIYCREESVAQAKTVIEVLRNLVGHYIGQPEDLSPELAAAVADGADATVTAVTYVAGMTDRFAFQQAERLTGWDPAQLPPGFGRLA